MTGLINLTRTQRYLLARADSLETASEPERRKARQALAKLKAEADQAAEAASLQAHLAEIVNLERSRGETVEHSSAPAHRGRVRIITRDGLQALRDSGRLGAGQHAAGIIYRAAYEGVHKGELRSQLDPSRGMGGSGPSVEGLTIRAHHDAKRVAMEALAVDARELTTLRFVAGEGRCISHFVKGGSSQVRSSQALSRILSRLAERYVTR